MKESKKLSQNYNDPAILQWVSNQRTASQRCLHICFYCYVINNSQETGTGWMSINSQIEKGNIINNGILLMKDVIMKLTGK